MKPISLSLCLAILATVSAPVLRSQDAPKPDSPLGAPIAVPDGFVVLDGKTYFVHGGQASPVDAVIANRAREAGIASPDSLAATLKPGTMMTMEGKVVAVPSGVVFSKLLETTPPADDRAADRAISSQNTTGLAPTPKNPNMVGQPGNMTARPAPQGQANGGAGTASTRTTPRNNNVDANGTVDPGVVVGGVPSSTSTTVNPDGSVTTQNTNGTVTTTNPANGTSTTINPLTGTSTTNGVTTTNGTTQNGTTTTNGSVPAATINNGQVATGNPAGPNGTVPTGPQAGTNGSPATNPNVSGTSNGTTINGLSNGTNNSTVSGTSNGTTINGNANSTNNSTNSGTSNGTTINGNANSSTNGTSTNSSSGASTNRSSSSGSGGARSSGGGARSSGGGTSGGGGAAAGGGRAVGH